MDLDKAHDRVNRDALWQVMRECMMWVVSYPLGSSMGGEDGDEISGGGGERGDCLAPCMQMT